MTGAASGIGRATTLRIAREGGRVIASDISSDRLAVLVADNPQLDLVPVVGDISVQEDVDQIVEIIGSDNGLYGSLSGSSVDFGDAVGASTEMDFVAGWSGSLAPDWALDVNFTRYQSPGSKADLDWNDKQSRSSREMADAAARPALAAPPPAALGDCGTVLLGFPIWWYEAPRIIESFLDSGDFAGKTVIPFATSGGSGMGKTAAHLRAVCPQARWREGRRFAPGAGRAEVRAWLDELGL